ncbi:MAG: antitoxin VbhA family protein [Acidithiobacillus ferrooxidans]|nr:antitoxin VbhA family protein [Acidithiobacillus ferrooxidans]MDD5003917.1 antitoxin VbhA family protein [Acidithiobacillus sp.]MDD5378583.1 antitoxin VbhA family protein [Acidithiobacillus sp.]MDD5576983.1 antitoxin VbhA family protein [Acidithiobacillus sp.]
MNKEVTMTFRLEPDLRTSFTKATEMEHRPAAQVLREFMRDYVEKTRSCATVRPPMSAAERERREDAVNYARSSVGLESFKLSRDDEEHAQRFINGEIALAEFVKVRQ